MNLKYFCDPNGTEPSRGSDYSAGLDLYSSNTTPIIVNPNETQLIDTGLVLEIPSNYFGLIASRSGLGVRGLSVAQGIGVIDADYRGFIKVPLYNRTDKPISIEPKTRIAQLIIMPFQFVTLQSVPLAELNETDRGSGGFGSTGK